MAFLMIKKKMKEVVTMSLVLEEGRPASVEGRLEKEIRVYDLLDSLGISYGRIDHKAVETMEECAEIDKVLAPAEICKNLFLCNSQKTQFYLLMTPETKRFKTKEVSKQIGSARLSFASAEFMEKFLDITPGAVSVMGLMNDKENQVRLLVDEDVLRGEYVGCHPCVNTASLRIKSKDVFGKYLKAVHHDYTPVHLEGEQ
jgi:Ala-tRNA(Pro) deacylase